MTESSESRRAGEQALRLLSLRAYGEQELYRKLLLKHEAPLAAAAVAKMVELGLVNDAEFARLKAEGMAERGKSPRAIADKLWALGIDRALAAEAVAALGIDAVAAALALLRKSYSAKLRAGERDKVMAALARRGFSSGDIRAAVAAALAELESGEDDEAPPWEGP